MTSQKASARAHTNIALIKYWGKKDQQLILPMNGSLSLTLDHFYTDTTVEFNSAFTEDTFYLNQKKLDAIKVSPFLDLVRQLNPQAGYAHVISKNHVPNAAGLASSASAFAALALAASTAAGLKLSRRDLSRLARRGSGSATRSIYGGFVEWLPGTSDQDSYAVPIDEKVDWDIEMLAIIIDRKQKKVSSREGMQRVVATSPFYPAWVKSTNTDLIAAVKAVKQHNLKLLGQLAESNALRMHALNLSARPPFSYFEPQSLVAMNIIEKLRSQGVCCYYTLDAGPNVKVICSTAESRQIISALSAAFAPEQIIEAFPGPGAKLIEC
ncbi:mvaD protein [Liquorilactobacillus ghanensis DSM 18630]|uniref:diphosphomevalonate decarboxylase n=1 Tax=Liquorilactobacillus ghanensis DSM 18630 TaxID=1423750 RepID=A0A0R1VPZ0_9LACO|nr:diphosphomevalonate decarboxylase [Liquorilactobacillus ghanensis]KRM07920.1 mvaD protein [Liquorilactobacillus ghanensis DSM 18630]